MIPLLNDQTLFARQIAISVSDMIYILDCKNDTIELLNAGNDKLQLEYRPEKSRKNEVALFNALIHPDDLDKRNEHIAACMQLKDGEAREIDLRLKTRNGAYHHFSIRDLVFSRDEEGVPDQLTGIVRRSGQDITPAPSAIVPPPAPVESTSEGMNRLLSRKNRELHILHSEFRTLTTMVAQDYLETLRQVYVNLEMIVSTEAQRFSNSGKAHLRRAQSMLQRLHLLSKDIVDYANLQASDEKAETLDLNPIIDAVLKDLEDKIVRFRALVESSTLPAIEGHPTLLSVLFNQLLTNALKFRQPDRPLVIRILYDWLDGSRMEHPSAIPGKRYCKIVVKDNGIGFNPGDKERIFEIFFRGEQEGEKKIHKSSGTGLAIARKIMDIHGGFIAASSIPGEGAEFCCYFLA